MLRILQKRLTADSPEAEVVRRAQAKDADAFRLLFERHVSGVRRFLADLLREPHAADEATQETFVRAHLLLPKLNEASRFKPWVLGIARNVAFEHARVRRHESLDEGDDEGHVLQAVIPSPNPETLLIDRQLEAQFARALETLKPQRRAALLLRLDHGLTYEDIAEAYGWPLQKVKNEIHRARLALRAQLLPHLTGVVA